MVLYRINGVLHKEDMDSIVEFFSLKSLTFSFLELRKNEQTNDFDFIFAVNRAVFRINIPFHSEGIDVAYCSSLYEEEKPENEQVIIYIDNDFLLKKFKVMIKPFKEFAFNDHIQKDGEGFYVIRKKDYYDIIANNMLKGD